MRCVSAAPGSVNEPLKLNGCPCTPAWSDPASTVGATFATVTSSESLPVTPLLLRTRSVTVSADAEAFLELACLDATTKLFASADWDGLPRFRTRFGLHRDQVRVGHFGAPDRISYTALGDGVNLAFCLEGLNKVRVRSIGSVNVSIGTQAWLRVQPGDRPTFDDERLQSGRPEERNGLLDFALVESSLEGLEPVGRLKLQCLGGRSGSQTSGPATSPNSLLRCRGGAAASSAGERARGAVNRARRRRGPLPPAHRAAAVPWP
jgi:hypothetical protein